MVLSSTMPRRAGAGAGAVAAAAARTQDGSRRGAKNEPRECYMCFSRVSDSAEAIMKGDVILPRCGHAVHGYPCFLEMVTHGAEGGAGSGYRGCCRYCHARLVYDKMQRSALRAR